MMPLGSKKVLDSGKGHTSQQRDILATNETLQAQVELLKAQLMNTSLINELTKVLHSCTDLDSIIKTILLAIQEIITFDRIIVFEIDKKNFCLRPKNWVGFGDEDISGISIPLGFDGGEITDALFLNRHIVVDEPDHDTDIFLKDLKSISYLIIPLVTKVNKKCWEVKDCNKTACPAHSSHNPYCWSILGSGLLLNASSEDQKRRGCLECPCFKAEGVFWMDRNVRKLPVSSDDITILTAVINLAGIIIQNFRIMNDLDKANSILHRTNERLNIVNHDLQVAQARIRSDLEHANTIQRGLLPQGLENTSDFSVGARYFSADAVGGDYYDLFPISEGVYGIVVADVSGHGIASALIMAMVKALLKNFATVEHSPQRTLEKINQAFLADIKTDNFVTIFYAVLDTKAHVLRWTSAGHCPILLLDRQLHTCTHIKADGLFLGVFPDMMLNESSRKYTPGKERIVLYTDGLLEAKNLTNEMYGIERFDKICIETLSLLPDPAIDVMLEDQKKFCGSDAAPEDDVTLLVIDL